MKEIKLTPEQHKIAVDEIKSYFHSERDEEVSDLAAVLLLDFITKNIGKRQIFHHLSFNSPDMLI